MRKLFRIAALGFVLTLPLAALATNDPDGTTPLHWAVYDNDVARVEQLIKSGANVNAMNDYGATPLSEAAVIGNAEVVRRLLKAGADVELANADGQTALMILARSSNIEAAKLLLKQGAKVDRREAWRGQTALMWAAAEGQPAMVKLLVEHGADVDARSTVNEWERQVTAEPRKQARPAGGFTPLLYAARKGCAECARILIKAGADINLGDPDRVTPLLLAAINLNFDTAAVLVQAGADVNKWDTWGRAPLFGVVDVNTVPTGGRADRPSTDTTTGVELVEMLLKAGANPNMQLKLFPPYRSLRDDRGADGMLTVGTTPLLRAAKAGDVPVVRLLLQHGALVDLPTVNGITPLLAAAGVGSSALDTRGRYKTEEQALQSARLLLDAGADIKARDRSGATALHGAASQGWNTLVTELAARNADLFAKDGRGRFGGTTRDRSAAAQADGIGGVCAVHRAVRPACTGRDAVTAPHRMQRRRFMAGVAGAATAALAARSGFAAATRDVQLGVTPLAERLWLIRGAGGNVTVFQSPAGVLLVDGGAAAHSAQLLAEVKRLTGTDKVHTLFNTHWHADQTGSNAVLGKTGTRILAHENTRLWLTTDVEVKWEKRVYQPLPKIAQPNQTFYTDGVLDFGGERIEYGYLPQAHTDGDIFVHFRNANVLVAADVVSVGAFPLIDYCTNGWIGGVAAAVQTLIERCDAGTRVVPGIGAPQPVEHLRTELAMLNTMRQRLARLLAQGMSIREMIDAKPAAEFEAAWGDPELFIANSWPGMVHRTGELGVSIV